MFISDPPTRLKAKQVNDPRDPLPACSQCGHASVRVIVRAERVTYVQCRRCHHVRGVANGPAPPLAL